MRASVLLALVVLACTSPGPRVPFRVVLLGDDPLFGSTATAIAATLERDGVRDLSTTVRFAPTERTLLLPPRPYGTGYTLVVETELSGLVLGRGRSFPFAVTANGADRTPDVSLGLLGRFGSTAVGDTSEPYVLLAPSADGALLASQRGLTHFVAHGADGRPAIAPRVDWPASRIGGVFVPLGDGVLVVGGAMPGASLVAPTGRVIAELSAAQLPLASGAAAVALDASTVLLAGGMHADGTLASEVFEVSWSGSALAIRALAPLPQARTHASALALVARGATGLEPRVLVYDGATSGGTAGDVVLVDPSDRTPPSAVMLPTPVTHAAACALDTGLVLLAGGLDATSTPHGQVTILVVQIGGSPPVQALSPAPRPLFRARQGAVAIPLGAGIALIVGGVDATGHPVAEAEIAEVRLDFLPGNVVLTGSLTGAGNVTAAARLLDHTVLVSADGALSLYFPPRGD